MKKLVHPALVVDLQGRKILTKNVRSIHILANLNFLQVIAAKSRKQGISTEILEVLSELEERADHRWFAMEEKRMKLEATLEENRRCEERKHEERMHNMMMTVMQQVLMNTSTPHDKFPQITPTASPPHLQCLTHHPKHPTTITHYSHPASIILHLQHLATTHLVPHLAAITSTIHFMQVP